MTRTELKTECIAFANWLSNTPIQGRTITKLWSDYETEILDAREPKESYAVSSGTPCSFNLDEPSKVIPL